MKLKFLAVFLVLILSVGVYANPDHLFVSYAKIERYYTGGKYERDVEKVVAKAKRYLERQLMENHEKPIAIMMDIDHTILSMFEYKKSIDFGFTEETFQKHIARGTLPAIPAVLSFYQFARKLHVPVFFVTARLDGEEQRKTLIENLRLRGVVGFEGLYLRKSLNVRTADFKQDARKQIQAKGYEVVLNMGDQKADLDEQCKKCNFKLPNYLY